jgi:hypothetical protein
MKALTQNTAFLVIHGIGNQNPLETLDQFTRGLVTDLQKSGQKFHLEHKIATKPSLTGKDVWFDNFIRINLEGTNKHIDIYEYYWANKTEDKISIQELQTWLNKVADGADKFYKENIQFGIKVKDVSPFFIEKDGKWTSKGIYYKGFVFLARAIIMFIEALMFLFGKLLSLLPILGSLFQKIAEKMSENALHSLSNVLGDIAIYNTADAKSKFYDIRRDILGGAVNALRYLVEPNIENTFKYEKVILTGHSLGTQVAFDTINRLNHLINNLQLNGFDKDGKCTIPGKDMHVSQLLAGLITFGSPLDKTAFFFRDQVKDNEWVRKQVIEHYHCFRQKNWYSNKVESSTMKIAKDTKPLFENIPWLNFYDRHDYVSGALDYYDKVTNIDCNFNGGRLSFTHSWYWEDEQTMYPKIVEVFL